MPHFGAKGIIARPERAKMTLRSQPADSRAQAVVRTTVLFMFAIFLAWLVITQSFAAYFAAVAPETALWLQPRQPVALDILADRTLNVSLNLAPSSQGTSDQTSERQEKASAQPSGPPNAASGFEQTQQNASNPKSALNDSGSADDLARRADLSQAAATKVRTWAKSALMNDPLNARALRVLGQLEAADKDYDAAAKLMNAAARLSLHESGAVYWSMRTAAEARDYKTTIYYADALLRTNPQQANYVVPILAKVAEDRESNGLIEAVLDNNPPWRGRFFAELPNSVEDARTPLGLLLGLKTSPTPPTTAETAPYVKFLIGRELYDLAYYTWLQFLPVEELREAGLLFNGSFDVVPSGLPFDWMITPGSGVRVDIVPKPDSNGKHALLVDFAYGRVDYHSVRQLVMLAPGTYEFKGQYKGQLDGPRGLKWRIVCANGPTIEESPMIIGLMPSWRTVAFTFTVPATDCPAQYVRLDLDARTTSERLVSGSMLFDELQISRVTNPS
jgi:tetratricopeptide (TPR) repeat protein